MTKKSTGEDALAIIIVVMYIKWLLLKIIYAHAVELVGLLVVLESIHRIYCMMSGLTLPLSHLCIRQGTSTGALTVSCKRRVT